MSKPSTHARRVQSRPRQWTLEEVYKACHAAVVVYVALEDLDAERRSRLVTPTRAQIAVMTGITRKPTLSKALTNLEQAHWIQRTHVGVVTNGLQTATVLRIVLLRRERKTFPTEHRA